MHRSEAGTGERIWSTGRQRLMGECKEVKGVEAWVVDESQQKY